ncbi:hypothetical protein BGW41_003592 [Actinomortierella wolfii]|nr:hypothetical protein BGW41_003592 [Actinomortierella wolfii]
MKFSAILILVTIATVANAQGCWSMLETCKSDGVKKDIALGKCQEAEQNCSAEKNQSAEQARCWKCAYTEVQRCVNASGGNSAFPICYKNGLRMRKFCLEGKPCGYERPGELHRFRFQDEEFTAEMCKAICEALDHVRCVVDEEWLEAVLVTRGQDKFYSNGFHMEKAFSIPGFKEHIFIPMLNKILLFGIPTVACING